MHVPENFVDLNVLEDPRDQGHVLEDSITVSELCYLPNQMVVKLLQQ